MDKQYGWLRRCIEFSFRLYPQGFRQAFEQEMRAVYNLAAQDAESSGFTSCLRFNVRELSGVLAGAMNEYRRLISQRGGGQMGRFNTTNEENAHNDQHSLPGDSHSWGTLLAGSTIFFIWGLEAITNELAYSSTGPRFTAFISISNLLCWLVYLIPPVVIGYAWTHNFPRWTYPYIGAALLYAVLMDGIPSPEFPFSGDQYIRWGWRSWIPLILALGSALSITRSLRPVKRFFSNAWQDWTNLSYALFGWFPVFLLAGFDEVASGYTLIFMPVVVVLMVATSLLYLACLSIPQRARVLFFGGFLSLSIMMVATEIYWSGIAAFNATRVAMILIVFLSVMFSPGFIGLFRNFKGRGTAHLA